MVREKAGKARKQLLNEKGGDEGLSSPKSDWSSDSSISLERDS